jgi:hypothetical protein
VAERTPNAFVPLHVLLSAKSVDDAAVIVCVPPAVSAVPFTVTSVPERRLVPIEVVATTVPDPFVERSAFDKSRAQATTDLMKIDREKAHEFLGDNPRPDDEHWLVIDQVYEVWLNHDSSTPELEQLKRVVLSLKSQGYIFKSMTVTSFAPHMRRVRDSEVVATWQVPNTVLVFVQK